MNFIIFVDDTYVYMHYMHSVLSMCTSLMYTCVTVLHLHYVDVHGIAIKKQV